jgi:hypothetical protein
MQVPGAEVEPVAAVLMRPGAPAEPPTRLDECDRTPRVVQRPRGSHTGGSGSDDNDIRNGHDWSLVKNR